MNDYIQLIDHEGAAWVKIYSVGTSEMNDYNRAGVNNGNWSRYGAVDTLDATLDEYKLERDRSFTFVLDKLDVDETGDALNAARALSRQTQEVVIPEVDRYTFGVICENAGHKPEAVELTSENIYDEISKATEALDEACVPAENRVLVVSPKTYRIMKKSKEIVLETEIGENMRIKGVIGNLDGMLVQRVASFVLPDDFGFLVLHKNAAIAPTKLESFKTHEDPPGIDGFLVEGRIVYGAFILKNKAKAIYYQAMTV